MSSIMQHAIDIDESQSNNQEQRLNALLMENRHLKQLLIVHEQMHNDKNLPEVMIVFQKTSFFLSLI